MIKFLTIVLLSTSVIACDSKDEPTCVGFTGGRSSCEGAQICGTETRAAWYTFNNTIYNSASDLLDACAANPFVVVEEECRERIVNINAGSCSVGVRIDSCMTGRQRNSAIQSALRRC